MPAGCDDKNTFLVDTRSLLSVRDLTCDDTGKYNKPSTTETSIYVYENRAYKPDSSDPGNTVLYRRYYRHKDTSGFLRTVFEIKYINNSKHPLAAIKYEWQGPKKKLKETQRKHKSPILEQSQVF